VVVGWVCVVVVWVVVAGTPSGVVVGCVVVVCVVVGAGCVDAGSVCVVVLCGVVVCAAAAVEKAIAAAAVRKVIFNFMGGLPAFEQAESTTGHRPRCTPNGRPFRVPDERAV
jgi:hypothetical protein